MSFRLSKGFTLLELMVTVAVLAILSTIAFPSFQSTIRSNRVAATGNEMTALLSLARSEAVRNKRGGGVCGSATGTSCDNNWSRGMLAWADVNGDGTYQAGETILRYIPVKTDSLTSGGPSTAVIAFDNRGRRRAAAAQSLTLQPTSCGGESLRRQLDINAAGQINSIKGACQ